MEHNGIVRTELELIQAVGGWADKNFGDRRGADWGMVEEVGEAAHAVLKAQQKIRGFENEVIFLKHFEDAMADIIIYLCDWCYPRQAFFKFNRNLKAPIAEPHMQRRIVAMLLQTLGVMMNYDHVLPGDPVEPATVQIYNMLAQRVCTGVEQWAATEKLDLPLIVAATWAKVEQRDWAKRPEGPLPQHA